MLLIVSALCYLLPFYLPFLWPLEWLFPCFLYAALTQKTVRVKHLAVWSIGTTILHLLPICSALITMASGPHWIALIPPLVLISYISIYPAIWLIACRYFLRKAYSLPLSLTFWTISLWIYLLLLEQFLLWPFGRCEGSPFMNPLLPMAYTPCILAPLSHLPFALVLLWFCLITSTICALCLSSLSHCKWLFVILMTPWLFMAWHRDTPPAPAWIDTVGHLPLSLAQSISLNGAQAVIRYELDQLIHTHPQLRLIIMPESSWNNALLTHTKQLTWLTEHPITHLIIGSFAQENETYFNSLYWYHNGIQIQRCDKQHAVPLVERITLNAASLCSQLYFPQSPPICPSKTPRALLQIPDIPPMNPYICSDLYCNTSPDNHTHYPLLATSNDAWFMPHFQILMALAARLRAIQWNRSILYISYHHAYYFDQYGKRTTLSTAASSRMIR